MRPIPAATSVLVTTSSAFALCPPMPDGATVDPDDAIGTGRYAVQTERAWAVVNADLASAPIGPVGAGADPALVGAWETPRDWPVVAIHAAVLPTGKVLHYSYPGGGEGSRARVWDPATGLFSDVDWNQDLFCSGHSHMPDGRIFVTGGNDQACEFQGLHRTNLFDPFAQAWTPLPDMDDGRWYPTNVMLPDGRVLIFSGLDRTCEFNAEVELYDPDVGLTVMPNGHRYLDLYPRMHLLTSGRIAHVGTEQPTYTYDVEEGWRFVTNSRMGWRAQGTSVLLPGETDRIMIVGGYTQGAATNTCEIIDFADPEPSYRFTGAMRHARAHFDALILPDKTILAVGGGTVEFYGAPVFVPEIYDPGTETWREAASHAWPRMYHATTVLLPDGRVLAAGQDDGAGAFTGEIYHPPYLFRGERPVIAEAPVVVPLGRWFDVATPDAGAVASVVLVKLSSVTHSVNFEQRLLDLEYRVSGEDGLRVRAPVRPTAAPPGFYMLFILNGKDVPSVASIVHVEPWTVGDVDGDGDVDFGDLQRVLASWGPCPKEADCPGDVTADGVVGLADLLLVLTNWG